MGKKGDKPSYERAAAFLLKPDLLPKLFGPFASRYSTRPGGYTRIHKFGNRPGDNAPHAILELVDNPKDLRYEMTSRAIGWEVLKEKLHSDKPVGIINKGMQGVKELVDSERALQFGQEGKLRPKTRWNLQKVLKYRDAGAVREIGVKAGDHVVRFSCLHLSRIITVCIGPFARVTTRVQDASRGAVGGNEEREAKAPSTTHSTRRPDIAWTN
jgi:hypothetical protein